MIGMSHFLKYHCFRFRGIYFKTPSSTVLCQLSEPGMKYPKKQNCLTQYVHLNLFLTKINRTIFTMSTLIQHCDVVLMLIRGLLGPGCLVYYCDSKPVL